jgi:SanA protein
MSRKIAKPRKRRHWFNRMALIAMMLCASFVGLVTYANLTAVWASRGKLFDSTDEMPAAPVGLVFGTSDKVDGRENLYFRYRIDAAVALWKAGKLNRIIVSGSAEPYYNEPEKMKRALMARGIPGNRIESDEMGLRTLDSVVRAREYYGADPVVFISQRFQNERAIYLAQANGIDAIGFNARDVSFRQGLRTRSREVGARVKMWLDVNFLKTRPRHAEGRSGQPG